MNDAETATANIAFEATRLRSRLANLVADMPARYIDRIHKIFCTAKPYQLADIVDEKPEYAELVLDLARMAWLTALADVAEREATT